MATKRPEERVRFIEHGGTRILLQDFSGIQSADELAQVIAVSKRVVASQPARSLRLLTDASDSRMDRATSALMRELAEHHTPYVLASAMFGIGALARAAIPLVNRLTGRTIVAFATREEAEAWLVTASR